MTTYKLETFAGGVNNSINTAHFYAKLVTALNIIPNHSILDCTSFRGAATILGSLTIKKPITILLGNIKLNFSGIANSHMFIINSANVRIHGANRVTHTDATNGGTTLSMATAGRGYHIYCANTSSANAWASFGGLELKDLSFEGVKSAYTVSSGVATYTTVGSGGILIAEGNPNQSGSNIPNIKLENLAMTNTKHHGIMIYGAITSKLERCRVRNTAGHGYYVTGSSTSMHLDTCYALSTNLAGFCLHDTNYSTLTSCAADNCKIGYWLRNTSSTTLNSCGAEGGTIAANNTIPNSLGISLNSSAGSVSISDVGSDNVNFFKGISYLVTGGGSNTFNACYSKDPGNAAGQTTYGDRRTSHITFGGSTSLNRLNTPKFIGTSPLKYSIKFVTIGSSTPIRNLIDIETFTYDGSATEPTDTNFLPIATVYNQNNSQQFFTFD